MLGMFDGENEAEILAVHSAKEREFEKLASWMPASYRSKSVMVIVQDEHRTR
jgi:hypothetical protein